MSNCIKNNSELIYNDSSSEKSFVMDAVYGNTILYLVDNKASRSIWDTEDNTLLHIATLSGQISKVQEILKVDIENVARIMERKN